MVNQNLFHFNTQHSIQEVQLCQAVSSKSHYYFSENEILWVTIDPKEN